MTSQQIIEAFSRRRVVTSKLPKKCLSAAVCVILGGPNESPSLCFIKRSERPDDPWSGHMAFPGGHITSTDDSPRTAAEREATEEVGLNLSLCRYLGSLQEIQITQRGQLLRSWLQPFVYLCSPDLPSLYPQASEVAEAMWIPITHLTTDSNRTSMLVEDGTRRLMFPGISYDNKIIWGITLRALESLIETVFL